MGRETAEPGRSGLPGRLSYLPPAWVALTMLLSLRQAIASFPLLVQPDLPESVHRYLQATIAESAVVVPWSLFLLVLAFNRSPRFPRQFVIWQAALLAWLMARDLFVLVTPEFSFGAMNLAWSAAEAAIGLTCIWLVTRYDAPAAARPAGPLLAVVAGLLGILLGSALGFGAGLLAGAGIAELTDMSCFEGACGFFAVFVGLAGGLIGAVAGLVLALRAARVKPKAPA